MKKVTNLTLHKNTLEKHKLRELKKELCDSAKWLSRDFDLKGFALVIWDDKFNYRTDWSTGWVLPSHVMPEYVKGALLRDIGIKDSETATKLLLGEEPT